MNHGRPGRALLPDDVLAEILARLPPRGVAVSRAVCKAWRAVGDDGRLLRADLLLLSVGGIFLKFQGHNFPEYFSRPSTNKVSGHMDYLLSLDSIEYDASSSGHCNGLVLLDRDDHDYIAFDPTSSPDYQVVSVPHVKRWYHLPPSVQGAEWPPSSCTMHLLSSRTSQWEERSFARQGKALEMQDTMELPYSAYLNGTLYVCCQRNSVMRISLTNNTFRAIKPPFGITEN
ncbi:hypothetical protein QOZ80_3AG0223650 [Eleusine coracana subsp. coracana]|nr:hypothetical protein QOZ80_3AG0223650 [Eleusine coracana subsp. coracana]